MNTIADYISQKDEIARLKNKIKLLQQRVGQWKFKYKALLSRKGEAKTETPSSKATIFVQAWLDGDKSLTLQAISDKFFLSRATIKAISYKLRHQHD